MSGHFLQVLGCSGGAGDGLLTTCFWLDKKLLIDAGTGLGNLSEQEMLTIDNVLITHSHLDHIALLPLWLERVYTMRTQPVTIYGLHETLETLKQHIFNWEIYPDFAQLSLLQNKSSSLIRYQELEENQTVEIAGWQVRGVAMDHTVPGLSYIFERDGLRFAFTGDTRSLKHLSNEQLDVLLAEVSYPDEMEKLADTTGHMTPSMLKRELVQFTKPPSVWISHLKPHYATELRHSLEPLLEEFNGIILGSGKMYPLGTD